MRVLIVEDLPRVQSLLVDLVSESEHCEVAAIADTEARAIAAYEAEHPDAAIVDLSLRQGSGLGVITQLRRQAVAERLLLIVLTNHAQPVLQQACRAAGADHFLDKSRDFRSVRLLLEQAQRRAAKRVQA